MNKTELINSIASKLGQDKGLIEKVLDTFEKTIIESLQHGEEVTLTGFGAFIAKYRHARKGVNPQKPSETIDVPAVTVPKFKAGKNLKEALKNGPKKEEPKSEPVSAPAEPTPAPAEPKPEEPEASAPVSENDGNVHHMQ